MEFLSWIGAGLFVQLALLCYVLGLLTRDELVLRLLILAGTVFYTIYYFLISDTPLWDAIWASAAIGAANLFVLALILRERSTIGMDSATMKLYAHFPTLLPGQFRKLIARANLSTVTAPKQICTQGEVQPNLYFLTKGSVTVLRDGAQIEMGPGNFIGEIAFLIDSPATATVIANPGSELVCWDRARLDAFLVQKPEINNALRALINIDVAHKLTLSTLRKAQPQATPSGLSLTGNQVSDQNEL